MKHGYFLSFFFFYPFQFSKYCTTFLQFLIKEIFLERFHICVDIWCLCWAWKPSALSIQPCWEVIKWSSGSKFEIRLACRFCKVAQCWHMGFGPGMSKLNYISFSWVSDGRLIKVCWWSSYKSLKSRNGSIVKSRKIHVFFRQVSKVCYVGRPWYFALSIRPILKYIYLFSYFITIV